MKHDDDRPSAVDAMVKSALNRDVPPGVEHNMRAQLAAFREHLELRAASSRPKTRSPWPVLRVAGAVAAAILIIVGAGPMFGGAAAPTWAEVVERFDSVPFFNATVYVKANAVAEPTQLELWMARGGRMRMRAGNKVGFGDKGKVVEIITLGSNSDALARLDRDGVLSTLQHIAERVGAADTFSFDTLAAVLPFGGKFSAPLENNNASISRDLVVFDMINEQAPEWTRVWALRESRLPVRVLFWDPATAQSTDVILSYANEQPAEFFDAEVFKLSLAQDGAGAAGQAYALLKDPGGRPITPQDAAELSRLKAEREVKDGRLQDRRHTTGKT